MLGCTSLVTVARFKPPDYDNSTGDNRLTYAFRINQRLRDRQTNIPECSNSHESRTEL